MLSPGTPWPAYTGRPLSFLGQMRIDQLHTDHELPVEKGCLLAFFYDLEQQPWGYDPADRGSCHVIQTDPHSAIAVDDPVGTVGFPAHELTPIEEATFPDLAEPVVEHIYSADIEAARAYWEALDDARTSEPIHRMFGWSDLIQNPMQLECQLASHGIYVGNPEGYRDPRVEPLRAGAADWLLLLQVDTDEAVGWMWGDLGRIYFWITEQDLRAGRFENVWLIFQCS
jgi:uncharacterized protein YwqG